MKGEVRIEQTLEEDSVFETGRRVILSPPVGVRDLKEAAGRETELEFFRRQHGRCIAKFRGIDHISEAEKYIGYEVKIGANELPALSEGSFYTFQLKGCRVVTTHGEYIGAVDGVLDSGGVEILRVDYQNTEMLIPFAELYVKKIDLCERRIEVDLPDELRNLNK